MTSLLIIVIYLAFISLGLPDALLGAAWPTMYTEFGVPLSAMGVISVSISLCSTISALAGDRLNAKFGTAKVTAVSVALIAVALFGFSVSRHFWFLWLMTIPYGLGAGSIDAGLNNYVAVHYSGRQMSWLHCMFGIGVSVGPYAMGYALTHGMRWNGGYRIIGFVQLAITFIVILSLPLWNRGEAAADAPPRRAMTFREILRLKGAGTSLAIMFFYCALEQSAGLWAGSYLVFCKHVPAETAATFSAMYYIGLTVGRFLGGFVTMKLNDTQMIRLGETIVVIGIITLVLSPSVPLSLAGFLITGFGCAPIFPAFMHATPERFGADKSQALIGIQMAGAYVGLLCLPALFGPIAERIGIATLPAFLLILALTTVILHEILVRETSVV
ncbi:MAG: MFS transporter [Clostridia bacterium]|nr:MFS transporter [Clostridia bacterium]